MSEAIGEGRPVQGTDETAAAPGRPLTVTESGLLHTDDSKAARHDTTYQKWRSSLTDCRRFLTTGWTEWRSKQRDGSRWLLVGIVICIILVATVPPICTLHGCGAGKNEPVVEDDLLVKRLLVNFDELGKTVKSKVSPVLYDFFEEVVLSFGVNIVSFNSSRVLYQVQRILEAQPDVRILLIDRPQYRIPVVDPFANVSLRAPEALQARLRRQMQAQAQAGAAAGAGAELGDNYTFEQWSLDKVAARDAWSVSEGDRVVVAVIDTGCDLNHPDLKDNLWVNRAEQKGAPGVDDDSNSYVDDIYGYDFAGPCNTNSGTGCGPQPTPQDSLGHGSHCAGIIGAIRNNGVGIAGVAPNVAIMCLKATPNNGGFYLATNLQAIDYAIRMGAHIISCSFGPDKALVNPDPTTLADLAKQKELYNKAMESIKQKNMLLVAAAGNELTNIDDVPHYDPCTLVRNYTDNVLCVMATDDLDQKLQTPGQGESKEVGSNFGTRTVSIAAPGLQILSTVPPLYNYNQLQWYNLSGTSMATPLVAGVAALVMSILGSRDGNFYQGAQAKAVIMDSGVRVEGLEVQRSQRVSASGAVRNAMAVLRNYNQLTSDPDFDVSKQTAIMQGFSMAYYRNPTTGPPPRPEDQPLETNLLAEGSPMGTRTTRFDNYKMGNGTTLVVTAKVNLARTGMYLVQVNTTANRGDVVVYLGQIQLRNLSDSYLMNSSGGWYDFVLRYVNPVAPIEIRLAEPPSGGAPALNYMPSVFYTATVASPYSFSYAPQIALSSTWQVLTRRLNGTLNWSSILKSALTLQSSYDSSAVVESLNFTTSSAPGALYTALGLPGNGSSSSRVVGLAHTRMRAPDGTPGQLRFRITCEFCVLYVNGLRVADVYQPQRTLQPATQLTNCVVLGASVGLHELVLRFGLNNVSSSNVTTLAVGWLPCNSDDDGPALPLGPLLMNNLLWKPSSGVAGYVGGMQCDMWLTKPPPGGGSDTWQPFFKFRLPTALAQTRGGLAYNFDDDSGMYDIFIKSRCTANETSAPACRAGSGFRLRDLIARGGDVSTAKVQTAFVRCWTYINAGFSNGMLVSTGAGNLNVYLGSQQLPSTNSGKIYQAPAATSLAGYHQLLVLEFPDQQFPLSTLCGNGSLSATLAVDLNRTLLPLPLLGAGASAAGAGTAGRHRRQAQQVAPAAASAPAPDPTPAPAPAPPAAGFRPRVLGDSPYTLSQLAGPGLCGISFTPNADYTTSTAGLTLIAAYNLSLTAKPITGSPCGNASAGLVGPVCSVPGKTFPRYVQFPGFLRVPVAALRTNGPAGVAAGGGSAAAAWALRVVDDENQVTAITVGDVTVRNGMDYPVSSSSGASSETLLYLPAGAGGGGRDLYLPTMVSARTKYVGAQAWFSATLVSPDRRTVAPVDSSMWLRSNGSLWMCVRPGNTSGGTA